MASLDSKTDSLIMKPLPKHGNRIWSVIVEPTLEPVTVDELKVFAHIDGNDEDATLAGFIKAARVASEQHMGRALIHQTIDMKMDYWPSENIKLPMPPLVSITKVAILDEDDVETEYSSNNYFTIAGGGAGRLVLKKSVTAPTNASRDYGGYLIRYVAGYGAVAANIPQTIIESIKLWASSIYETRIMDPKKPPPEAKLGLDLYVVADIMVR